MKTIVKNVTLLNDCIVTFRLVYCLIADNSCSFSSIVPKALLSFVRVLTNILLLIIILVLLCRSLLDGLLYFIFNMTGRAVGQRRNFMVLHSALFENVWVSIDMYAMSIGSVGRRVVILG